MELDAVTFDGDSMLGKGKIDTKICISTAQPILAFGYGKAGGSQGLEGFDFEATLCRTTRAATRKDSSQDAWAASSGASHFVET